MKNKLRYNFLSFLLIAEEGKSLQFFRGSPTIADTYTEQSEGKVLHVGYKAVTFSSPYILSVFSYTSIPNSSDSQSRGHSLASRFLHLCVIL